MTFTFLRGEHVDFASDGLLVVAGASALMFARWLIVNTALRPAAIKLMGLSFKELDGESRAGVEKFCKSGWHFIIYVISVCWGVMILFESEWSVLRSGKFEQIWLGYPHPGSEKIILKAYFLAHISWYLHGIFESVMVDTSRTDFGLLVIHHFLAVALLVGAFWGNVHRATITMCILQEISDVVMHFSRIVHKSSAVPWLQGRLLHALLLRSFFAAWVGLRILPTSWVLLKLPSAAPSVTPAVDDGAWCIRRTGATHNNRKMTTAATINELALRFTTIALAEVRRTTLSFIFDEVLMATVDADDAMMQYRSVEEMEAEVQSLYASYVRRYLYGVGSWCQVDMVGAEWKRIVAASPGASFKALVAMYEAVPIPEDELRKVSAAYAACVAHDVRRLKNTSPDMPVGSCIKRMYINSWSWSMKEYPVLKARMVTLSSSDDDEDEEVDRFDRLWAMLVGEIPDDVAKGVFTLHVLHRMVTTSTNDDGKGWVPESMSTDTQFRIFDTLNTGFSQILPTSVSVERCVELAADVTARACVDAATSSNALRHVYESFIVDLGKGKKRMRAAWHADKCRAFAAPRRADDAWPMTLPNELLGKILEGYCRHDDKEEAGVGRKMMRV